MLNELYKLSILDGFRSPNSKQSLFSLVLCCTCIGLLRYFSTFVELEFARAGNVALQTAIAVSGPMNAFTHDIEPQLRKLGLPTSLDRGRVCIALIMKISFKVCRHSLGCFYLCVFCEWLCQ